MAFRYLRSYDDLRPKEREAVDYFAQEALQNGMDPNQQTYNQEYISLYPKGILTSLKQMQRRGEMLLIPDLYHIMREAARRILSAESQEEAVEQDEEPAVVILHIFESSWGKLLVG